ncbi:site-specific DNA-methyltransferase [Flavobacterium sp.]|uniref:site-specific DNA-methyltransferase n=1 Tax=Flavobacterium sp. TaxID=239 RepID=UPI0035B45A9F
MESINDFMPNSNDWNNERLQTLKQLYPDWFTNEGNLNIDEIKKAVNPELVNETERYEFRWFGKSQAKRNAFTPSNATLVFDEDRSVNPSNSENLIIEGENLEVLKLLSGSYREKIKCIYIDPPYNTGKDFVYSDNFTQDKKAYWEDAEYIENGVKITTNSETDGRYHSNWLNMMYSRLLIARQLLKEDGVIFISIDDNEVHHLRKLCDEVFGEENFVAEFIWKSRQNKDNRATTGASIDHEYIICYIKNSENKALKGSERKTEQYSNPDNDYRGDWASGNMVGLLPENLRPNCHYDLIDPKTNINYGKPKMGWRYDKNTMNRLIEENRIIWPNSIEGRPRRKVFLNELSDNFTGVTSIIGKNIYTKDGTKELNDLFDFKAFDFPKPSNLIKELLNQVTNDNDIVLDFFSGSGSTGSAIFQMNNEAQNNLKYILIQIPEAIDEKSEAFKAGYKKISDITIERNKRVVENLIKEKKSKQPDLFTGDKKEDALQGLGFKVFKLQKSNFPRVDFAPDPEKTEAENVELLKTYIANKEAQLVNAFNKSELLTEILLKNGYNLNYKLGLQTQFASNEVQLASDGEKETLICLDVVINADTVDYFKTNTDKKFICLERALDTTKKYNLKHYLGDKFNAF